MADDRRSDKGIHGERGERDDVYGATQQTWGNASRGFENGFESTDFERADARRADSRSRPQTGEHQSPADETKR